MGTPGSTSEVSEQDALCVFGRSDPPDAPRTTAEIAAELDASPRSVRATLETLAERGDLHTKALDDSTHLWWPRNLGEAVESIALEQFRHEQFGAFINAVEDYAIFLLDPDGHVVSWNHGAERIKGYAESEIVGDHFSTFYTADAIEDGVPEVNLQAAAEDGSVEDEGWRVRKDGSRFWATVTITAIRDDDGELRGYTKVTRDMTERREYERQLEAQAGRLERQRDELEHELDEVFERVDDAVYALDDELRFAYVNERAEAYLGTPAGDLLGRAPWEALDVDEDDPIFERFETAMATQEPTSFERYSDPLDIWAVVRVYPSETGLSVYFRDITERKRAEQQLRESEERFRTMMEQSPFSMQIFDAEGAPVATNPAWEDLWEAPREELADYNILEDEQLEDAGVLDHIRDAFAGEVVALPAIHYDPAEIGKPGRARWVEGYAYPLPGGEGKTREVAIVHHDVTERKEREQELERYEIAVETVWDAITVLDEEERFVLVNEAFCELTGYDREEILGEHATLVLDEATYEAAGELHEEVVAGVRDIATLEYDLRTADGRTVPVEALFGPVEFADGTVGGAGVIRDITQRKARERELQRIQSRMEFALDSTDAIVWDWNVDADQASFYPSEETLYGTTVEDWEDFMAVVHPEDRETVQSGIEHALETGEPKYEEVRIVRPDGSVRWIEAPGQPVQAGDDEPTRVIGVVRDVTERKERERTLERYETIIEKSADVNAILDPDGTLRYVTPSVTHVLGYDPEDLLGEDAFEHLHPDDRRETRGLFAALVDGDRNAPKAEFRFQHADGSWVWLEAHGRNLLDDPDIQGLVVYTRDVTDRKHYEAELESRARQQEVVAELGQTALETPDLDDLFDEAARLVAETLDNDYCKVLDLDRDEEELLLRQGVGWQPGIVGEATVSAVEADSQASYTLLTEGPVVVTDLDTESRFSGPELLTSHDVRSGISTVIGSVDDPWGILGTHDTRRRTYTDQDVTFVQSVANILAEAIERHSYQDELEELVDELEESNRRLEQFAYVASHDLQEPLRMVTSYLQLLDRRHAADLEEDAREYIDYAVDGADRMRAMITDLLAYSRIDTDAEPLEPTDGAAIVERVRQILQVQIEESDAEIEVGSLPTVAADENQLEQVFQNLLSNAIKYSGDEPPHVEIGADRDGEEWVFHVADDGIGMDADHTDQIFDVFQRLHTHEEYPGTGIGLALCQKIVDRHGGRIWAESAPGEGTTVFFTLPPAPTADE